MTEPRQNKQSGKLDEEFASTSTDGQNRHTANDSNDKGPAPQGGKGTPSQAEGDREDEE